MSRLSQFIREKRYVFQHKIYGKCYMPLYNRHLPLDSKIPEIYNKYGRKLDIFFLRDSHFNWSPYGGGVMIISYGIGIISGLKRIFIQVKA